MYDYKNLKRFEKSQVNGLTKHLMSFRCYSDSNQNTWNKIFNRGRELGLEIDYSHAYGERLSFISPRKITKEQTEFGKNWLKHYFYKLDGKPRSGKRTQYVSDKVLKIAKQVTRFEFVGVQVLASQGWYPAQIIPIYRAYNKKGDYFDYAPVHWGEPLIME